MDKLKKHKQPRISLSVPVAALIAGLIGALLFVVYATWDSVEELPSSSVETTQSPQDVLEDDFFAMTADDCTSFEQYDAEAMECYYECDTDAECEAIEAQIEAELDALFGGGQLPEFSEGERPEDTSGIAQFAIENGEISSSASPSEQDQELWDLFAQIAPADMLANDIVSYETYSDDQDGTAAYVAQVEDDFTKWILGVNHSAMYVDGSLDRAEAIRTMIHEMAHILTLRDSQVPADSFGEACDTIELQEGCANASSYIASFNEIFWNPIRNVWPGAEASEDELFSFYEANMDQFVSDYAATNLGEDIAESFTSFVIQPQPTGNEIKDRKVRFFYDYPELVRLRDTIRQTIAL